MRGSLGRRQDPASCIPPLVSEGETFATPWASPLAPVSSCLSCNGLYFLLPHTLPLFLSFSPCCLPFFFAFYFPIIMRDICLQAAREISSAPAKLPLLLSPISSAL